MQANPPANGYRVARGTHASTTLLWLGLALVAKIIGDHGGIIECESQQRQTVFRVLMPMFTGDGAGPAPA